MHAIMLHLDRSNHYCGLYFEQNGQRVPLGDALEKGFCVSSDDAPTVATWASRFIETKEERAL